ncbi:hypothetical protein KAF25_005374, partial [Fusarium avenaceum]
MKRIVQLSIDGGKPIIGININYRLGAPGFMTSKELQQAGYKSNRGLHDQRMALQWVERYIAGFGGDPSRVTVAGESVGGLSATRLMYSEEALASRIVVMGGAPPSVSPLTSEVAEFAYNSIIEAWGIHELSPSERLKSLETFTSFDLHQKVQRLPILPVLDDDLVPYNESFKMMASEDYKFKAKQCQGALIVFSPLDASIFAFMGLFAGRKSIATDFINHLTTMLPQHHEPVQQVLESYKISSDLDNQNALLYLLQFGSDIGHHAAALALAENVPGDVFLMQFSEPNPWDGPFKGHSTHILDVAFLLQNFNDHLDETQPMDPFTFQHESLQTTLRGFEAFGVAQFRGIPYGYIPRRFAEAEKIQHLPKDLDCTEFGPKCPQIYVDVGHLLRIPTHHILPREPEDEFTCTNLDVVLPKSGLLSSSKRLPVLVWIHGGSQAVTFGNAASGICVADSIRLGKPIIVVSVQYRLNAFALGNGEGSVNLALRDQALALQWVQENIAGFNGDPTQVTLAGESAGAVYCHAHLVINSPARQFILASGSLFLSPPQPPKSVQALRNVILKQLQATNPLFNLDNAPVEEVVKAIRLSGIQSFFLQWEDRFNDWQIETKTAERILLSDMEREAAIWQAGVRATSTNDILKAFNAAEQYADQLKKMYHIYLDRPSSCQNGALDFINDYKYLVDEVNPWQSSSGAHHALDLVLLFGGFDQEFSDSTK